MALLKLNRLSVRATSRRRPTDTSLHRHQANSIVSPLLQFTFHSKLSSMQRIFWRICNSTLQQKQLYTSTLFLIPLRLSLLHPVTEIGLEKFGIQDGIVGGGDEIEDKTTKRRSGTRVRYGLTASIEGR